MAMAAENNEAPNEMAADVNIRNDEVPQINQRCSVRLRRLPAAAPRFQPYGFRHARLLSERENYARIKCTVCRRIFRMYDVPADFDVDGNICSVECTFYGDQQEP